MKKIFVAGSSGFIGHHFVNEALKQGYKITALTPKLSASRLSAHRNLEILEGTILNPVTLNEFMAGSDYAVSTIGDFDEYDPDLYMHDFRERGTKNVITAAKKNHIKKTLVLLGAPVLRSKDGTRIIDLAYSSAHIAELGEDIGQAKSMFETMLLLQQSDINWTAFCPGTVTNDEKTGQYQLQEGELCGYYGGEKVAVGDLINAMLTELKEDKFKGKLLGIKTKESHSFFNFFQNLK